MSAYLDDFSDTFEEDEHLAHIWALQEENLIDKMIESFTQDEENQEEVRPKSASGRGRPRKYFTKKVTMIEVEASGWLIRASRGRPKKGEVRVEVEVPFDLEIASKRFYTCENGVLAETWGGNEQR